MVKARIKFYATGNLDDLPLDAFINVLSFPEFRVCLLSGSLQTAPFDFAGRVKVDDFMLASPLVVAWSATVLEAP